MRENNFYKPDTHGGKSDSLTVCQSGRQRIKAERNFAGDFCRVETVAVVIHAIVSAKNNLPNQLSFSVPCFLVCDNSGMTENPLCIGAHDALLVIDVQNDFCPEGALAVPEGDAVVAPILRVAPLFTHVLLTQDWHPADHASFACAHPGRQPYEQIELDYGAQTLWPVHCVQGSHGAEFPAALELPRAEMILRKGMNPLIDSYSAFYENDRTTPTGLAGFLRERGVERVFLAGLAYDFCVGYSALDARWLGFEAIVLRDGCRAIDLNGSVARIEEEFARAGVGLAFTANLVAPLQ